LRAVTVKVGITDNTESEVIEGLKEGDVVVTGINQPAGAAAAAGARPGASPFGGPFGGMRPR
jgi:ABC-type sugar transport system substrate-binding protein